ncbi:hypothetical protein [Epilithonimonas mollis]|uniref:DUF2786 domain-containing protein n=1 Tax=Epilithonimonas mollis TaxID=216903 RepID=A0A1M6UJL3_9FLAO|nr:hypothetical protein [Epilithonimonas mollis]SHK69359.1 hypothetical protein SAMN05444371_3329 [Epilithonimonas mollis]
MTIDDKIRDRIAKVQALVTRGVDGEQIAAKTQLDRLLKKYNINPAEVNEITKKQYFFKYATELDKQLFLQLMHYFFKDHQIQFYLHTGGKKEISARLEYLDYITISCSYEYFKRHMSQEWKKFSADSLKKKRKAKTKNALRADLQGIFYSKYIEASRIYHPEQMKKKTVSEMTKTELENYHRLQEVQGGQYHSQVEKETLKIG